MRLKIPNQILENCADPQRAKGYLEQLQSSQAAPVLRHIAAEQARILTALLAGSQQAGELLLAHPEWLPPLLEDDALKFPRRDQGLRREVNQWLEPLLKSEEYAAAWSRLRHFRQRELLRIAARDLARLGPMPEITREISDLADVCLQAVYQLCWRPLAKRDGEPWHLDAAERWQPTAFCVIGLGKLGGQELNYSSDIDVLFVYEEEGHVFKAPPRRNEQTGKGQPSHRLFLRLAETMIAEISRTTAEGMLFRIDLRLRPEGKAGPLARSLSSYENYYAQWGQTWERMMLTKGRPVAGDLALGAEFLETIQSFRYPRSLNQSVLREIAGVKLRIEQEVVKQGEIERNVKLGRGGIREIEFVAQTLQLLHAGRIPFLQEASTLPVLQRLVKYSLLPAEDAANLEDAYIFLREVEHRLQMDAGLQTHTIPTERRARERLARLMGAASLAEFEEAHRRRAKNVRRIFDQLLAGKETARKEALPSSDMEGARSEWVELLQRHGFREPERAIPMVGQFLNGPGFAHVSRRTMELARQLFPRFLALCAAPMDRILSDPDRVLVRLDSFIDAYGARAMLYELWTRNPALFELLLLLFDRSEFLAERAIRTPDLVDELETSGRLNRTKSAAETLADLRHGSADEDQRLWLRRYHQAELMRLGLRDILGLADFERNLFELSCLADACLQYALEVLIRRHRLKSAPFCIVGLGKLGGQELNYGSDLDLLFVADSAVRNLPQSQRIAAELMEMLSATTEAGTVFRTDARLRPDGEKGLLVTTLDACQSYYQKRAALWEIQSLTRLRPIAGDLETGAKFLEFAAKWTDFRQPNPAVAAYSSAWKSEIANMRERIARERTPAGQEALSIKTGIGGLMDAEFLAQAFCLEHGWQEPNTMRALRRGREAGLRGTSPALGLLENYSQLRRIEGILRRWSFEGETVLPPDAAAFRRVAIRCGHPGPEQFAEAVGTIRSAIRRAFNEYFGIKTS